MYISCGRRGPKIRFVIRLRLLTRVTRMIFVLLLPLLITLMVLYAIKQRRYFKLTEHIPGPTPLPFIGNALELGTNTADFLKNAYMLTKKYGSVVRLCVGSKIHILLTDPKYIAQVITETEYHDKGDVYRILGPLLGESLLTTFGENWARRRGILNSAFSNKQLGKYVVIFNDSANKLVHRLKQLGQDEYIDIAEPIFTSTLYSLCKSAMNIDTTENKEYHHYANKLTDLIFSRYMSPLKMSDFFYSFTNDYRETKKYSKLIDDFVNGVIKKRKQEFTAKSKDARYSSMLDVVFRMSEEESLTDEEMLDEVKTFVFAGSDTVGVALSFAMYELAKKPDIQVKVLQEIEDLLGTDTNSEISYEDANHLKYMECVLKETMRLYAPAVFITRILPGEMNFDGIRVPANSVAIIFIYGLHKSEKIYPNPERFDPDRFLPENSTDRHPYSFIPFSVGARLCIGHKFAMLEAKVLLAKMVRNFEIMDHPTHIPVLTATGTLKSTNGLPVKLRHRKTKHLIN